MHAWFVGYNPWSGLSLSGGDSGANFGDGGSVVGERQ